MLESASDAICASPYGLGSDRVRTASTVNALPGSRPPTSPSHRSAHPPSYPPGQLIAPAAVAPRIRLDGRDMRAFHPILTTDYFEYGTTTNGLEKLGAAVEMGDAALGLACSELDQPPYWAVIRNISDPV